LPGGRDGHAAVDLSAAGEVGVVSGRRNSHAAVDVSAADVFVHVSAGAVLGRKHGAAAVDLSAADVAAAEVLGRKHGAAAVDVSAGDVAAGEVLGSDHGAAAVDVSAGDGSAGEVLGSEHGDTTSDMPAAARHCAGRRRHGSPRRTERAEQRWLQDCDVNSARRSVRGRGRGALSEPTRGNKGAPGKHGENRCGDPAGFAEADELSIAHNALTANATPFPRRASNEGFSVCYPYQTPAKMLHELRRKSGGEAQ
jgi:hypothetical protein